MKKKRMVNDLIRGIVGRVLLQNPDCTAGELKKATERELKRRRYKDYRFTERTYLNLKKEIAPNIGPKPEDVPWTVGSCIAYGIPGDLIPLLLEEQKHRLESRAELIALASKSGYDPEYARDVTGHEVLTIRQAKWFCRLHPTVSELAKRLFPGEPEKQRSRLSIVSSQYARREQVAQLLDKAHPDTADIDAHLMQGDLSDEVMNDAIVDYVFPEDFKKEYAKETEEWQGNSRDIYEHILGELTDEQVGLLNDWWRSTRRGAVARRDWEQSHPEVVELVKTRGHDFLSALRAILDIRTKETEQK